VNEEKDIPDNEEPSTPSVDNETVSSKEDFASPQLSTSNTKSES
jgi:hypothetical protein